MGNQTLGRRAVQGSNAVEEEVEGEKGDGGEETERPRRTHGGVHTYRHTPTHTHTVPPVLCLLTYGCHHYKVQRFLSPHPSDQLLHVLPYSPN